MMAHCFSVMIVHEFRFILGGGTAMGCAMQRAIRGSIGVFPPVDDPVNIVFSRALHYLRSIPI